MINETLNEADAKMKKAVEVTREDFAAIRTGRANPSMFHKLTADYYGTPTPLQQLASFTAPEARIIMVQPYDMGAMANVEKAIRDSDPHANPDAVKFDQLSYDEFLTRGLKVADATSVSLCRDNDIDMIVFNLSEEGNIARVVSGEKIGTTVARDV